MKVGSIILEANQYHQIDVDSASADDADIGGDAMHVFLTGSGVKYPLTSEFHYYMFHGAAVRTVKTVEGWTPSYRELGDGTTDPLHLMLNTHRTNEVIFPSNNLVVSERLAKPLQEITNLRIVPTEVSTKIKVPYETGSQDYFNRYFPRGYGGYVHASLFRKFDTEKYRSTDPVPNYFEIVVRLPREPQPAPRSDEVKYRCHDRDEEELLFEMSEARLREDQMIYLERGYVVCEDYYKLLEPHLDPAYFHVSPLTRV